MLFLLLRLHFSPPVKKPSSLSSFDSPSFLSPTQTVSELAPQSSDKVGISNLRKTYWGDEETPLNSPVAQVQSVSDICR
jgi:hypothetical protein